MIKYVTIKSGEVFVDWGVKCSHQDIIKNNEINIENIIDEGFIENNKLFSWYSFSKEISQNNIKAREVESLYAYGYIKQGD
jgi:hypothetical protein